MKYFVVSDIHSFYFELVNSLRNAGFDKRNKDHTLIVVGDVFDRGPCSVEVYRFLSSIPKKRCILIRGNHESLYLELLRKSFPERYDFSNHTVDTFCQIAGYPESIMSREYWYKLGESEPYERIRQAWAEIKDIVEQHPITAWVKSKQWRNFFELDRYVFCHSFIPVRLKEEYALTAGVYGLYNLRAKAFEFDEKWRNANDFRWEDAAWGDPVDRYLGGLFEPEAKKGKVLVVGHWHTADFYARISNRKSYDEPIQDIWLDDHMIALDGGVFRDSMTGGYIHPQNVLVLDSDDFGVKRDAYGQELKPIRPVPRIETVTI